MRDGVLNSQYEFIIVFDNNAPYNRRFDKCNFDRGTLSNLWNIKRERNEYHKAAFPQELIRKILYNFTNENDVVMDPFMGSGTVGICCNELKRRFIGIEINQKYFDIATKRMEEVNAQMNIFDFINK